MKTLVFTQYIKNEKSYLLIRYLFYKYYEIICSDRVKKEKLYALRKRLRLFCSLYAISKKNEPYSCISLYLNPLTLKKKHFLLFCNRFFFLYKVKPRLLSNYLSMLIRQQINKTQ